ncbi:hypothetical protein [Nocardia arthritidis]|uniref:Uncharacterized protein n=1 Tax=Nocardia arthritidis TaxID=228602 RepID=A0A6G9YP13_9NOCA|nr:hypothetical protein [Nocardia arthritidis]QIS14870.1 hypothetical protein F5544_35190 [Nocardia arthritidis]
MGLAIGTHELADLLAEEYPEEVEEYQADLDTINLLLAGEGLPQHDEPRVHGPAKPREHLGSFPYSFLHYLRRAYAHAYENPDRPLAPVADGEHPADDRLVEGLQYIFETHLICHSDAEGYYVPIDFEVVLADEDLTGGMVGSSVALLRELIFVAPYLGIELHDGELTDAAAAAVNETPVDHPFERERIVWLALFENARVSVANGTMITFQ